MISLFGRTKLPNLEKAMTTYSLRQKTIASNIANATTPGYQKVEVSFEDKIKDEMNGLRLVGTTTSDKHLDLGPKPISKVEPEVVQPETADEFASGYNNVDIDQEMALLAQNQLQYRMTSRLTNRFFKGIQSAIRGQGS
jgi:flagellar basal-body rod protein FlgB